MKNGVMIQYFEWNLPNEGNLWMRLRDDAAHLAEAGFTSVWIPPAYKADEQQDEGYATYDLFDLGEFDQKNTIRTKYGTGEELKAAIDELHKHGIQVYLDAVMNQKAGADYTEKVTVREVDQKDRTKDISGDMEIEAYTGYEFKGRNNAYSDFKWRWQHFSGTGYDDRTKRNGIFRIIGENKYWSQGVDDENGNYDYLLCNDIDLEHPGVIAELNHWGSWVSGKLGLDGMRLDAIKHMDSAFVKQFLASVRASRGDKFYAVGEYWKGDFDSLEAYLGEMDFKIDLFDVPLHYKMYFASEQGRDFDLTKFPEDTLTAKYPANAVTFVDNHDTQRGSSLVSCVKDWFKPIAYGLILLMEKGYPCVFFGDYYGVKGQPSPHKPIIDILLDARRNYAYGEQHRYFDHPNTVGLVRMGDDKHPGSGLAMLFSNGEDGDKTMNVGQARRGEVWHEITGSIPGEITIGDDGNATFRVHGGKLAVWVKNR